MGTPHLTVTFRDFSPRFDPTDNFIVRALSQSFEVEVTDEAEICIFSVFGPTHETFEGHKIQIIGEPLDPAWHHADNVVSFDRLDDDRHLRFPCWAWSIDPRTLLRPLGELRGTAPRTQFCLFLYSNPRSPTRNAMFHALDARRSVTSPGSVLTNAPPISARSAPDWWSTKVAALRDYRFSIAAENCQRVGYTTEKLTDAFRGGAIPIYWGDPSVDLDFDRRTFLDLARFDSIDALMTRVLELEDHPELLEPLLAEAPLTQRGYETAARPELLAAFLERVITTSRRDPDRAHWRRRRQVGLARAVARRAGLHRIRRLF